MDRIQNELEGNETCKHCLLIRSRLKRPTRGIAMHAGHFHASSAYLEPSLISRGSVFFTVNLAKMKSYRDAAVDYLR